MRCFRVVSVLNLQDFPNCFSVHGALKRPHKGEKYRSWAEAGRIADQWAQSGWYVWILRRVPNGWQRIETVAPEQVE